MVLVQVIGTYNIVRIHHIGSTAVPGLLAKSTIDILVEIEAATDINSHVSAMQKCGYRYLRQPDNPPPYRMFIKGYTPEGFKGQAFHVQLRYKGDWDELYFRDYLIAHPDTAHEYAALKVTLKQRFEHNQDAYTHAKTEFIARICKLSRSEGED